MSALKRICQSQIRLSLDCSKNFTNATSASYYIALAATTWSKLDSNTIFIHSLPYFVFNEILFYLVPGHIRIRAKSQGMALSLGDKINSSQKTRSKKPQVVQG